MFTRFTSDLYNGIWLMDRQHAEGYLPLVAAFLEGKMQSDHDYSEERQKNKPYLATVQAGSVHVISEYGAASSPEDAPRDSVAVIPINGPITKYDQFCGPSGTKTKADIVRRAGENPNIVSIVLHTDSPGGQAAGTPELAEVIRKVDKPVLAYVDDLSASAGYWINSAADEIVANRGTARIGSIGTFVTLMDFRGWFEEKGIKIHEIYADKSSKKNLPYRNALEGKYDLLKKEINFINESFLAAVRENREGKLNFEKADPLSGEIFFAEEAIEMGLIDRIATFEETLQFAYDLGKSNSDTSNTHAMFGKNKISFEKLSALAKAKPEDRNQEMVNAANKEIQEAGIDAFLFEKSEDHPDAESVQTALDEASKKEANEDKVKTLQTEVNTLTEENKDLKAENKTLKEKPGSESTKTQKEKTDELEGEETEDPFLSEADEEVAKARAEMGFNSEK